MIRHIFITLIGYFLYFNNAFASFNTPEYCESANQAVEKPDIEELRYYDKTLNPLQKEKCTNIRFHTALNKSYKDIFFLCSALYSTVENGNTDGMDSLLENFSNYEKNICIKKALAQAVATHKKSQEIAYLKLIKYFKALHLPEESKILDEILINYGIVALADRKVFAEHLMNNGARMRGTTYTKFNPFDLAFSSANEWGCQTLHSVLNKSRIEDINFQDSTGKTALMSVVDDNLSSLCRNENILLTRKTRNINAQDKWGNTALHYLIINLKKDYINSELPPSLLSQDGLILIRILTERGASYDIPNKQGITARNLINEVEGEFWGLKNLVSRKTKPQDI